MKISVFGLGYVGTITAACLAEKKMHVVGVDVAQSKVDSINMGGSPVLEPGVADLISAGAIEATIRATTDPAEAIAETELTVVCVGTPPLPNDDIDLRFVEQVCQQIADGIRAKQTPHVICLRSTIIPGSTRRLVQEYFSSLELVDKCEVLFVPEFLREGTALNDFRDPSTYVIGTKDGSSPNFAEVCSLFSSETPTIVNWEEAETVKYSFNAFHALKVCFANEIGRIGKVLSLDSRIVMKILAEDTVLNISPYYLRPGNPYGGSCLPKDVAALVSLANRSNVALPLISSLAESNRLHQELLTQLVTSSGSKKVCILGLSFKSNTDDLRNSPMVALGEQLLGKGYELVIVDPTLNPEGLIGSNKSAAAQALPHLSRLIRTDASSAIAESDVIVAALRCVSESVLSESLRDDHVVIDVNGWSELETLPGKYQGFCWD